MKVEFDYTRSLGPVLSRFMSALRHRQILGGVLSDGRVVVPPPEYDPITHAAGHRGGAGRATRASSRPGPGSPEPVDDQPLDRPFAFAQVLLDGADAPLLHAVAVDSPPADRDRDAGAGPLGRRDQPARSRDIACFEPIPDESQPSRPARRRLDRLDAGGEPDVTGIVSPVNLAYDYAASPEESKFFRGLAEGRILGQRCPTCHKVYVPPRGACPVDGVPTTDEVELPDRGTVTTFCIVNVPFLGQKIEPPYVSAYVLLDGADIAFLHLILERRGQPRSGWACASRRSGSRARSGAPPIEQHQVLPPDRRAGRGLRDLQAAPLSRTRTHEHA